MFLTTSIGKKIQTHHTNSVLVQKYDLAENLSNVYLDGDYNFERKNHQSYKSSTPVLSNFYLKRGSAERLKYNPVKNKGECIKSFLYSPVEAHALITKGKQRVRSWNGFYELVSRQELDRITIGYLPPLPFSPTETKVIAKDIRRLQDIMKELETDFIFIEADQAIYTKLLNVVFTLKNKGEKFFSYHNTTHGWFSYRHVHGTYNLQFIQKIWYSTAPFFSRPCWTGDRKERVNRLCCVINLHKKLYKALL